MRVLKEVLGVVLAEMRGGKGARRTEPVRLVGLLVVEVTLGR